MGKTHLRKAHDYYKELFKDSRKEFIMVFDYFKN